MMNLISKIKNLISLIIKPISGGSSYGLIKINNKKSLDKYFNDKNYKI